VFILQQGVARKGLNKQKSGRRRGFLTLCYNAKTNVMRPVLSFEEDLEI
jgi:hypothetical protein